MPKRSGPLRRAHRRIPAPAGGPPGSSRDNLLPVPLTLPVAMATGRLGVGETLEALNAAVGPGSPVWFKETHARHLRVRDFLAPRGALQARFRDGQVGARQSGMSSRIHGPAVRLHSSACRCQSACCEPSPACRVQEWPLYCAARRHPRVYRSNSSGPQSSNTYSVPWPPMLTPPNPPHQARELSYIARHCAVIRVGSD